MEKAFRKTGIDIIGDAPWGTHLCQFYQTKKDLIDILVPYFKAGLENNEFCMWITSEPLKVEDAKAALKKVVKNLDHFIKKGQIEILDYSEWYTKSGKFDANNVFQGWVEKENQALKRGHDGLRLSGNTFWLAKRDWRNFTDFEEEVNNLIGKYRMIAICTYSLGKCGVSEVIDVVSNHQFALVRREGEWVIIESLERKQAEKTLQSSEANLRKIVEKNADGIFIVDRDGLVRYVNPATEALFGCKAEELIGELFGFPLMACEGTEIEIIRRDGGGIRVAEVRLVEMEWEEKNAYLASVHDITKRKQVEQALRQSESKYKTLAENLPQKIFLKDRDSIYISCNEHYANDLRIAPADIAGKTDYDFYPKELAEKYRADDKRIMGLGKTEEIEETYIQNGNEMFIQTVKTPIKDEKGNTLGILGIFWDITERKRAADEMATLQEQLRQSQKMEAIGRLAGGIAHDFNNLLTVIKGYSQLSLLGFKEGDPLRGNLEEIKNAADRAADLIHQLLAFSRRQILEFKVIDLNTALRNLEKMLRRVIGENIELVIHLTEDLGGVKTDPGWIEQVIINLAVNAKDAMPEGGKLVIETANVELDETYASKHVAVTPGRYVMLSVSDTGVGMTPEIKEKVFEPFFTTKEEGKGTGLGLSTVYGIVKQSEGNIWVYSELGKGTTFKIYLPCVDEPLDEISEKVTVRKGLLRGSETILVAEDEEKVRKLVVQILNEQGYRVLEAVQGVDALSVADEHKGLIHLLVTDVVMPKMGGRELAERLKPLYPKMKVLYMSGYTDNAITHHGVLDKGMNFIQKPFTVEGLARKVWEVLDK